MAIKHTIVVALDLSDEAKQVLDKARELGKLMNSSLHLLHVVEPVVTDSNMMLPAAYGDIEQALSERADKFLAGQIKDFGLKHASYSVEIGSVKGEVFRAVEDKQADLIVIGTHGRHGIGLLLGSTANAILHGTPCDVYAVKIRQN